MRRLQAITASVREVLDKTTPAEAAAEQVAIRYSEEVRAVNARLSLALELGRRGLWMELRSVANAEPPLLQAIELLRFDSETAGLPPVAGWSEVLGLDVQEEDAQLAETIPQGNLESPPPLPDPVVETDGALEQENALGEMNTILNAASLGGAKLVDDWQKYCQQNGLETAPEISPTVLDEVRGALRRATKPRFDVLHRHYRRQCLGLASVEVRLETVRLIARRDRANVIWQEELRRLEVARVEELKQDLDTALVNGEPNAADLILDLLRNAQWCDPQSARRVVAESESRVNEAWGRFAHSQMQSVADEMFKHYMAEAVEQVEAQASVWEHYCERLQRTGLTVPDGPAATAASVLEWLQRQKSEQRLQHDRQSARETLERLAIDSTASPTELNTALIEAERMGCDLPPTLRDVAAGRLRAHHLQQRNQRRLKIVLVGCTATVLLAASVWLGFTLLHKQRLEKFVSELEAAVQLVDKQRVEQLKEDAIRGGFMSEPRVVFAMDSYNQKLEEEKNSERARAEQFKEELAAAGDPEGGLTKHTAIKKAADLARTDEEHGRVERWRELQKKAQSQRTTKFMTEVRALSSRIDGLERQDMANPEARNTLDEVEGDVTRLGRLVSGVDADAGNQLDRHIERVSTLRAEVASLVKASEERRGAEMRLSELDRTVTAPETFCRELEKFARDFPSSPYSEQFNEVLTHCDPIKGLGQWSVIASQVAGDPFPVIEEDRIELLEILKEFHIQHNSPVDDLVTEYAELLFIDKDDDNWADYLKNIIRTENYFQTKQVLENDGFRFFYGGSDRRDLARGGEYQAWTSVTGDTTESRIVPVQNIKSDGDSPQYQLGQKIEKVIMGRTPQRDGRGALQIIKMIRDETEVDPILRVLILTELLPRVQRAVPCVKDPVERSLRILKDLREPEEEWIKPCNPSKQRLYDTYIEALEKDVPVESWQRIQQAAVSRISEWIGGSLRPVGWIDLFADPKRSLRLGIGARLQPEEALFVVNNSGSLLQIGKVGAKGAPILDALPRTQPSGSLVFAGTHRIPRPPKGAQ